MLTFIIACCITLYDEDQDKEKACTGLISICALIVVIILEITCLVFFIKYYNDLDLLAIIGYFIQWIPLIVGLIIYIVCNCRSY